MNPKWKCDAWQPKSETVTRTHARFRKPSYFHAKQRGEWNEETGLPKRLGRRGNRPAWKQNVTVVKRFCPCKSAHTSQGGVSGRPTQGQERTQTHRLWKRPWETGPPTAAPLDGILYLDGYHLTTVFKLEENQTWVYIWKLKTFTTPRPHSGASTAWGQHSSYVVTTGWRMDELFILTSLYPRSKERGHLNKLRSPKQEHGKVIVSLKIGNQWRQ